MRRVMVGLWLCVAVLAAGPGSTLLAAQTAAPAGGPPRAEVKAVERLCDKAIENYGIDTIDQITLTHALYIEGYGVLISFEVNLSPVSPLVGLTGGLSKAQKERIRDNKLKRLPQFRQFLEGLLLEAVKPLEHLAPEERLLVNVVLDYSPYENSEGLPESISITAKKKDLLEAAERKTPPEQLSGILKVKVE
jgi:hypothetical protein